MATTSTSLSLPNFLPLLKQKPRHFLSFCNTPSQFTSTITISPKRTLLFKSPPHKITKNGNPNWRIYVTSGEALPSDTTPLDNTQQIVSTSDDGLSTVVSSLLFIAFIGLSILTIGVIYLGVTDFLQKREREKFEKEQAASKKSGKRKKVRARPGPKGFGQKVEEDDE